MNQKNKTILLIIIGLGVWGYAGMEWLSYLGTNSVEQQVQNHAPVIYPTSFYEEKERYLLNLNYKDPFLIKYKIKDPSKTGELNHQYALNPNNSVPIVQPKTVIENPLVLKEFQYNGMIVREGKRYALINIEKKSFIPVVGDFVNGYQIISIDTDSIEVELNDKVFVFKKK